MWVCVCGVKEWERKQKEARKKGRGHKNEGKQMLKSTIWDEPTTSNAILCQRNPLLLLLLCLSPSSTHVTRSSTHPPCGTRSTGNFSPAACCFAGGRRTSTSWLHSGSACREKRRPVPSAAAAAAVCGKRGVSRVGVDCVRPGKYTHTHTHTHTTPPLLLQPVVSLASMRVKEDAVLLLGANVST